MTNFTGIDPVLPDRLYTESELCQFFTEAPRLEQHPYWRDKVYLVRHILGTGMRASECLHLRVPEDCFVDGVMIVRTSKTGKPRSVKCSPELEPYYLVRLRTIAGLRLFGGITTVKTLDLWCKEVFTAVGVEWKPGRACHALRHTYATEELASERLTLSQVMAQLGHSSSATTLNTYVHALVSRMYQKNKEPRWWKIALPPQTLRLVEKAG